MMKVVQPLVPSSVSSPGHLQIIKWNYILISFIVIILFVLLTLLCIQKKRNGKIVTKCHEKKKKRIFQKDNKCLNICIEYESNESSPYVSSEWEIQSNDSEVEVSINKMNYRHPYACLPISARTCKPHPPVVVKASKGTQTPVYFSGTNLPFPENICQLGKRTGSINARTICSTVHCSKCQPIRPSIIKLIPPPMFTSVCQPFCPPICPTNCSASVTKACPATDITTCSKISPMITKQEEV